jgi:hypothetical protein
VTATPPTSSATCSGRRSSPYRARPSASSTNPARLHRSRRRCSPSLLTSEVNGTTCCTPSRLCTPDVSGDVRGVPDRHIGGTRCTHNPSSLPVLVRAVPCTARTLSSGLIVRGSRSPVRRPVAVCQSGRLWLECQLRVWSGPWGDRGELASLLSESTKQSDVMGSVTLKGTRWDDFSSDRRELCG